MLGKHTRVVLTYFDIVENFLNNKKADNYKKIVAEIISAFHAMKVNMSNTFSKYIFFTII